MMLTHGAPLIHLAMHQTRNSTALNDTAVYIGMRDHREGQEHVLGPHDKMMQAYSSFTQQSWLNRVLYLSVREGQEHVLGPRDDEMTQVYS